MHHREMETMTRDGLGPQEAADILFFEAEASEGFLSSLESERVFDNVHWQQLWDAVASLISHHNGMLGTWATYDLLRVVDAVRKHGQDLVGRTYDSLDAFEERVLEANIFLNDVFSAP
jgi:hypothetical protein